MRQFKIVNSAGDEWLFYAASEQLKYMFIGGQKEMADGSLRKWYRTKKRRWGLSLDILERSDRFMLINLMTDVNNLTFYADDLDAADDGSVIVQVEMIDTEFERIQSNEILYSVSFALREV